MSKICTCEQVSRGHVDKICDQVADAIVTDCLCHDRNSRVAIECLFKNNTLVIAGEITSKHEPDYAAIVESVFCDIGIDRHYDVLDVKVMVSKQSPDIAKGVDFGGAGDQGIMYGYATNETKELLPIPFAVATRFLEMLGSMRTTILLPDAKAQVSFDYDTGKITTFLCSVQHTEEAKEADIRAIVIPIMLLAAASFGLNGDFEKNINPTGRFAVGGSKADCGVTGR